MKLLVLVVGFIIVGAGCNNVEATKSPRGQEIGRLDGEELSRFYDKEFGVVCYTSDYRNLSCVKVDNE